MVLVYIASVGCMIFNISEVLGYEYKQTMLSYVSAGSGTIAIIVIGTGLPNMAIIWTYFVLKFSWNGKDNFAQQPRMDTYWGRTAMNTKLPPYYETPNKCCISLFIQFVHHIIIDSKPMRITQGTLSSRYKYICPSQISGIWINNGDVRHTMVHAHRLPVAQLEIANAILQERIEMTSGVVLAKKEETYRSCVDYGNVNLWNL